MLNIFFQETKDKQEYYDKLRACFTDFDPEIDEYLEKELQNDLKKLESCESPDDIREINDEIHFDRTLILLLHVHIPLLKASVILELEKCPQAIEKLNKDYSDGETLQYNHNYRAEKGDIFDILLLFNPTNRKRIINTLSCSNTLKDKLIDALSTENKDLFCNILSDNCDYTVFSHYFGRVIYLHSLLEMLDVTKTYIIKNSHNEDTSKEEQLLKFYYDNSISHRYTGEGNEITSFIDDTTLKPLYLANDEQESEKLITYITVFNRLGVFIGDIVLSEVDEYDLIEQSIFRPVLESEEFKQHYEENKEYIDKINKKIEDYCDSLGPDEQEEVKQIEAPAEEQEPEEQDDESSSPDVLQDVELLHTEPRFKFMYQYNSSFVSAAELQNKMRSGIHYKRGWKNTDIQRNLNNLYYKGAITYRPDTKDFPDEYDEVKWLYEKMVSLTAIENTPENFNSFMFRMTGKRKDNQVIIRIPWLLTANELYFWIGHIIGDSKSRIPDGTFPLSKNVFFETVKDEIEFDKPTASKVNSLDSTWRGELIPKQMFEDINKFIPEMLSTRKKIE